MLGKFQEHLESLSLLDKSDPILVGFSGGADSTCLLHALHSLGYKCIAAHLNHGQRQEAALEAEDCAKFCDSLGILFALGAADVPKVTAEFKIGIEEAGRNARYEFFQKAKFETSAAVIVTAHTLDDHVETVLFHMARGAGLAGLAGIPVRQNDIVRPLLPFRRSETQDYCQEHNLPVIHDPGNFDEEFARVRVRQRLIPEFETIHPGFFKGIERMAESAAEDARFLDGMAARMLEQLEFKLNENLSFLTESVEVAIATEHWESHPPALAKRSLRLLSRFLGAELDFDQTMLIHEMILSGATGCVTAEGGYVAMEIKPGGVHGRRLDVAEIFRFPVTLPGETESEVFQWKLTAQSWEPSDFARSPQSLDVVLDRDSVKSGLYLCSAGQASAMQPLNGARSKSVNELLKTRSLTTAAKVRIPIVCDMVGPIWIPGVALAERSKVTETTSRAIRLMLGPLTALES